MTAAAAHRLVDTVWPLVRREIPEARLRVAGRGMDRLGLRADDGVDIQGEVPSGAEFMREVSVLLFPPVGGSGTKVKVLEALASGLPVITTAIGTEGVASNDGVVVAEDDETLARAAVSILRDPDERRQRGAAGLQAFKDGHTPAAAAGTLFELYSRMANSG
jgi:glycosyltransferase involved in cell wall biosynthesis